MEAVESFPSALNDTRLLCYLPGLLHTAARLWAQEHHFDASAATV